MEKLESSKQKNPCKAIRAYCLHCCLESSNEVALCQATECELYEFRFGKNPHLARSVSEEQRQIARERMLALNSAKLAEKARRQDRA